MHSEDRLGRLKKVVTTNSVSYPVYQCTCSYDDPSERTDAFLAMSEHIPKWLIKMTQDFFDRNPGSPAHYGEQP